MNALAELKHRFYEALDPMVGDSAELLAMIRPTGDPKFGDYQANCAMPLGNRLGKPPREIAGDLIDKIQLDDVCSHVEIAGPGFINLTLADSWLQERILKAVSDPRLGVEKIAEPKKFVVDFSSPNVAKPMHVGHIRSTVIGDSLSKILKFVGHDVITDNHLGDWGTQFGMIIYGYKNFLDQEAYQHHPVAELGRLYKHVRQLMDFQTAQQQIKSHLEILGEHQSIFEELNYSTDTGDSKTDQQKRVKVVALDAKIKEFRATIEVLQSRIDAVKQDPTLYQQATEHPDINHSVLLETAALHAGDATNRQLWNEFLPVCRTDIQQIYQRLGIEFDHELGESFYQDQLTEVVEDFEAQGFARTSEGAVCVFLENYDTPMIIQKKDGAFLYSTTDLATIQYRVDQWEADSILYVVDHRQHQHFEKLFAAARLWGYSDVELTHVSFGTVLGEDGRPFKTRAGVTVGLEGLLDEAESRALAIAVEQNPDLSAVEQKNVSKIVGLGALKFADLAQNRASDYKFSYDKMLALRGNTATYLQYSYARVQGIIRKLDADMAVLRNNPTPIEFAAALERQLAVKLIRFGEALDEVLVEYKPNILCNYLFELTQTFFQFYDQCSVKDAETKSLKNSRLQLCDLTARTIETGLGLLGIGVMDQM